MNLNSAIFGSLENSEEISEECYAHELSGEVALPKGLEIDRNVYGYFPGSSEGGDTVEVSIKGEIDAEDSLQRAEKILEVFTSRKSQFHEDLAIRLEDMTLEVGVELSAEHLKLFAESFLPTSLLFYLHTDASEDAVHIWGNVDLGCEKLAELDLDDAGMSGHEVTYYLKPEAFTEAVLGYFQ